MRRTLYGEMKSFECTRRALCAAINIFDSPSSPGTAGSWGRNPAYCPVRQKMSDGLIGLQSYRNVLKATYKNL